MSAQDLDNPQCPHCQAVVKASTRYCPSCGGKLVNDFDLIHNPWVILGLLFLVMAILGLPLLWMSRGFSPAAKVVLSIVVTLYTAVLFWLTWLVLYWSYWRVMGSF